MSAPFRWSQGPVPVAVADRGVIAIDDSPENLEALWVELESGRALGELLQHLAGLHGNSVFALPDFIALTIDDGQLRVAARGRFSLEARTSAGAVSFTAPEIIAWDETHITGAQSLVLVLAEAGAGGAGAPDPGGAPAPGTAWPLRSGIVRALRITWGQAAGESAPGRPGPRATAPPAPQPPAPQSPAPQLPAASAPGADGAAPPPAPPAAPPGSTPPAAGPVETGATPAPEGPTAAALEDLAEDEYFGHLFEHTRATNVEAAAIRTIQSDDVNPLTRLGARERGAPGPQDRAALTETPAGPPPPPGAPRGTGAGVPPPPVGQGGAPLSPGAAGLEDWLHDGETITPEQLRAARAALAAQGSEPAAPAAADSVEPNAGPQVLAALCAAGHPNPVHATSCRLCAGAITSTTTRVARPALGILSCSSGAGAVLDADVIIGRLPQGTGRPGGPPPHLMAVPSPGKAISKSHCAVRVEGWDVSVEDLGSTNGTFLIRPGEAPRRVPEHQGIFLRPGDVIDLGDGITLTLEAAS